MEYYRLTSYLESLERNWKQKSINDLMRKVFPGLPKTNLV